MMEIAQPNEKHVLTFAWPLEAARAGGVDSAMLDAAFSERGERTTIFTTDRSDFKIASTAVQSASPDTGNNGHPFKEWFGTGDWQLMHPRAYTSATVPHEILEEMFAASSTSLHAVGTFARLLDHINMFTPAGDGRARFNERFDTLIENIEPGTTVNWQDFFFLPSVLKHAEQLGTKGCFQTLHWHSTLPDSLVQSAWGRNALLAMSTVDVLYVHTDRYKDRVEDQFERLDLPMPEIRRYDLGIKVEKFRALRDEVTPSNFRTAIPGFETLPLNQKELFIEAMKTRETVPHRFIDADRADSPKGIHTVLEGFDLFLEKELYRLGSLEKLRENYRFFGVHDLIELPQTDPTHLKEVYVKHVINKYAELQDKYPGIVFYSGPFTGAQRGALPAVMLGCTGVSGGAEDGLNLLLMEYAVVNEHHDTSIIGGDGAGFSMQVIDNGRQHLGHFPTAGSPEAFRLAFEDVRNLQVNGKGTLREWKRQLIETEILPRNASMAVSRFE